jgi:exonuclease III
VAVVALQETRAHAPTGWGKKNTVFSSPGLPHQAGVALVIPNWVLSKLGVKEASIVPKTIDGRCISISLPLQLPDEVAIRRLVITNVYRPVQDTEKPEFDAKFKALIREWEIGEGDVHICLGDFNGTLSPLDQLGEGSAVTDPGLASLSIELSLVDAIRKAHPEKRLATRRGYANQRWRRIDYVFHQIPSGTHVEALGVRFIPSRSDHHYVVGAFTGLFSLEKKRVIPRAKVSALLRDPVVVSQLLEAAWKARRSRHSTLWGAWDGWKKDAVKILLEQEQLFLKSLPPSPLVDSTAKVAKIIEQFGMEGSLGEEWDLLIEQFKSDLAQSAT